MTDMELAEEIEQWLSEKAGDDLSAHSRSLYRKEWRTIIAALRRGPLEEWSQQVRLIVRGIDGQAERITKREQTTWRDGENQAPDEDNDFEDVVIGYKLNTGLWHRLLGLLASCPANERPPSGEITEEKIDELWKQAMTEAANHFNGFLKVGMVPNFEHPENLTLPQRFAILLLSAAEAEGRKS